MISAGYYIMLYWKLFSLDPIYVTRQYIYVYDPVLLVK